MRGSVRRTQLITTYGVGAIVAVDDESVMVAGLDDWPVKGEDEHLWEPRLHIDGKQLRLPPGGENQFGQPEDHVPVVRFPFWYYCANPSCRRLDSYGHLATEMRNSCRHCGGSLVPSRFIAVCEEGHIEDFPYFAWVHRGERPSDGGRHDLRLEVTGTSGSLGGIVVECRSCDAAPRSLEGAFDRDALVGIRSCGGRRPWLRDADDDCGKRLRTTQRGASNVWFSQVRSVISIPPWSDGLQRFVQTYWGTLRHDFEEPVMAQLVEKYVEPASVPYSVDEVLAAIAERKEKTVAAKPDVQIRVEEYRALCQGRQGDSSSDFVAELAKPPAVLEGFVDLVTVVSRLREIRAFTGFSRLKPRVNDETACAIALDADWLPAVAVHGEGIFLRLDDKAVATWESQAAVLNRVKTLQKRWQQSYLYDESDLTGRFLLAHTFAHALIDEWSLAGGYPAASLRERIYSVEGGVGVLVYTAAADSAGSLGGLIAQAESDRFGSSIVEAVRRYSWCSSDPVCAETGSQGAEGLNLAACHACALLPETSCEHRNGLLDRALLVGLPDDPDFGFFRDLLQSPASP
jgi:hypothetical protein